MPKTADEVFRDFTRFYGDGQPNEPGPAYVLPLGDPKSGVWNPQKADIRDWANQLDTDVGGLVEEAIEARDQAVDAAADAASAVYTYSDLDTLLASVTSFPVGTIITTRAEKYAYTVVASDGHLVTAGGLQINVRPADGRWSFGALNPAGDGTTNDRPKFVQANSIGGEMFLPLPDTSYNVSSAITLTLAVIPDPRGAWTAMTDTGLISWVGGPTSSASGKIHRFSDRVFVGGAAQIFAGNSLTTPDGGVAHPFTRRELGPFFMPANSALNVFSGPNQYAITGMARGQDTPSDGIIAVNGGIVNDKANGRGWCFYADIQHEHAAETASNGLEVAAKNKSTNNWVYTPYAASHGVFGGRLVAGGDANYGGAAANPSTVGLLIMRNSLLGNTHAWNSGIVFTDTALTGSDGSAVETGIGEAIAMARRQAIRWYAPTGGGVGATLLSSVTTSGQAVRQEFIDGGMGLFSADGSQIFRATKVDNGVNYIHLVNGITTDPAIVSANGPGANIGLRLVPKGTGTVWFGTWTSNGDAGVNGYITIRDEAGNVRKLATIA